MDFSTAHLHLMFNHIPVLGAPFLALLLLIGLIRRSAELQRVALGLTVLLALVTIPIYLTGEPAEEQVEGQPWFDKDRGHDHEERAEAALVGMLAAGAVALGGLWLSRKTPDVRRPLAGLALGGPAREFRPAGVDRAGRRADPARRGTRGSRSDGWRG